MPKNLKNVSVQTEVYLDDKLFPVLSIRVNHSWAVVKGFGEINCQIAFYSRDEDGKKFLSVERKNVHLISVYRAKNKRIINLKSK